MAIPEDPTNDIRSRDLVTDLAIEPIRPISHGVGGIGDVQGKLCALVTVSCEDLLPTLYLHQGV